jgi:acetylornithine deacetylase/succinyl-diaminopimelate desuccinylase-like protein
MARKPRIFPAQVAAADQAVRVARDARALRQAQAVLLPVRHVLTLEETGRVIGRSKATVARMLAESRSHVEEADRPRPQWGGWRIVSGAGHDAKYLADLCPTAMIFIPCVDGVSHNEAEAITPAHAAAGANVLLSTVLALAKAT